jgi:hypothetical protein
MPKALYVPITGLREGKGHTHREHNIACDDFEGASALQKRQVQVYLENCHPQTLKYRATSHVNSKEKLKGIFITMERGDR